MWGKKNIYFLVMAMLISVYILTILTYNTSKKLYIDCIPTSTEAIKVGRIICEKAYPQFNYNSCEWKSYYLTENELWVVYCNELNSKKLGGGLPEVHIKKNDARVVWIGLQK